MRTEISLHRYSHLILCSVYTVYAFASLIINKQGDRWGLRRREMSVYMWNVYWLTPNTIKSWNGVRTKWKVLESFAHTHTCTSVSIVCRTIVITIVCHLPHKVPRNCSGKLVSFVYFYGFLRCSVHSHESYRYTPGIETIHITQQQRCCRCRRTGERPHSTRLALDWRWNIKLNSAGIFCVGSTPKTNPFSGASDNGVDDHIILQVVWSL